MMRYLRAILPHGADTGVPAKAELFRSLPIRYLDTVVFVGDSLTADCPWQELFGYDYLVLNRGIGGDTSLGVRQRANDIAALRPATIFLMIGTNDAALGLTPDGTAQNIMHFCRVLSNESPETRIYLQSVLPSRVPKFNQWSARVNAMLADVHLLNVQWVNLRHEFEDAEGKLIQAYTHDGLHLTAAGYRRWMANIEPLIARRATAHPEQYVHERLGRAQ